ncbi:hypothetical protein THI4931_42280 [Pandoraea sputorum]|nr:hypothetical protein THI4931_42280 [Pandoraea sputorum]
MSDSAGALTLVTGNVAVGAAVVATGDVSAAATNNGATGFTAAAPAEATEAAGFEVSACAALPSEAKASAMAACNGFCVMKRDMNVSLATG